MTVLLTDTQVRVNARITGRSRQVLVLTVWDVKMRLGVTILLGQPKVDDVDLISTLSDAHQEIVRLDVTMNERLGMDVLDAGNQLIGQQQHRLQGEFAVAKVEKILQTRPEQIENHGVVIALRPKPANKRNADASRERLVDASFIFELRMLGFDAL